MNALTRRFIVINIAIAVLGVCQLSAETWQGRDLESRWRAAPWKVGAFRFQLNLVLRDVGYVSNLYGSFADPIRDYGFTAGPELNLYWPLNKHIVFFISETPQFVYFLQTRNERSLNNFLQGEAYILLNKVFFTIGKGLSNAKQRGSYEIEIRPGFLMESSYASILSQISLKMSVVLSVKRNQLSYDTLFIEGVDLKSRLDRTEDLANLKTYFQLSSRMRLSVALEYGIADFADPGNRNESNGYILTGGVEFLPSPKLSGSVKLGYKRVHPLTSDREDYGGLIGDVQVSAKLAKFLAGRIFYRRDYPFSFIYSDTYYLIDMVGTGLSIYFVKDVRIDYDYSFSTLSYPERFTFAAEGDGTFQSHALSIYFRLWKNVGIGVTAGRWTRKELRFSRNATRNFVLANLTYDF